MSYLTIPIQTLEKPVRLRRSASERMVARVVVTMLVLSGLLGGGLGLAVYLNPDINVVQTQAR